MFEWDRYNLRKIRAHGIEPEEAEQSLANNPILFYEQSVEQEIRFLYYSETDDDLDAGKSETISPGEQGENKRCQKKQSSCRNSRAKAKKRIGGPAPRVEPTFRRTQKRRGRPEQVCGFASGCPVEQEEQHADRNPLTGGRYRRSQEDRGAKGDRISDALEDDRA
jgi:hypothetical protein